MFNTTIPVVPNRQTRLVFIVCTVLWACVVQLFFVTSFVLGSGAGGGYWALIVFYPQIILLYVLGPRSFSDESLESWKIFPLTIGALPASLVYGAIISLVLFRLLAMFRNKGDRR